MAEPVAVLSRMGYLSEENDLPAWMSVGELIRYTRAFYPTWDDDYAEELRRAFWLEPSARIRDLSRGQKARAGLIAALAHRPELLVLDEPLACGQPGVAAAAGVNGLRSHAAAMTWEFGRRHRWGFLALGVYFAVLTLIRLVELTTGGRPPTEGGFSFALVIVVPGSVALSWFIAVFTYGYAGNLAGRHSIFPSRLFTLPLTNTALATWPMLCGSACVAILWTAVRVLAPWPADLRLTVPYLWPGLLAVVLLAWTQALTWTAYPVPGLRVAARVLCLAGVEVASVIAMESRASQTFMIAMLSPQLPLAWLVARRAVTRARRGDVPDWSGGFDRLAGALLRRGPARVSFTSAADAQLWLEWNRFGRSLPMLVAILLPVELLLLWGSRDAPALVFTVLVVVALTPPFMASFTAVGVRKSGEAGDYGVSPFTATRPLSSAALVGARLRMALWSTAAAWLLVIAMAPAALVLSDTGGIVADRAQRFAGVVGAPRAIVFGALVLGTLVLTTWRQMVQSLYIGLTGRPGLIRGSALAMLCLVVAIGPLLDWAWERGAGEWFWVAGVTALVEGVAFYAANRSSGFITVDGRARGYVLHVPRSHDHSRPAPLVISLHGAGLWGRAQGDISRWNDLADREGFIVAYPSGAGRASPRVWGSTPGPELTRDVEFITRLIDTLVARHNVDPDRVHVNGLSNGGAMTFALSCAAPERLAALESVVTQGSGETSAPRSGKRRPLPIVPSRSRRTLSSDGEPL